ncbi:DEAD-box ATP-dependent RNA helicase 14 [Magnolia sinica]|uniref:DEAD-box ATP-dependent RNA helicase 14 n=1 Tax=Magnolia sinica TaxID=86752 RepID=UPI0026590C7F|nr:DEAD-box ATP-dependent RNA helicase 14 [Magnolia sinica]
MAITASASSTGPRYAPPDPTLPKPWRGLVDGKTGYLYFWNPVTNVTQYERPVATPLPGPLPVPKSATIPVSSSVQIQQSSGSSAPGQKHQKSKEENDQYGGSNHDSGDRQGTRDSVSYSQNAPSVSLNAGHGVANVHNHGSDVQPLGSSAGVHGAFDVGGASSAESYRRKHEITVRGDDVPAPFMTFQATGFPQEILREAQHAGFSAPTPIQAQSWPIALKGRDIVAVAKTGSGKTLGYLIPGFIHLKRRCNKSQMGPTVLVLSPTRELATQIQDEAAKFGKSSRISCTCLYGGAPKGPQLRDLERGTDVVVATPGRLNDILEMRRVSLQQVSYLVLDEADRMLDMGFEPQIRKIVKEIPARRQTLMYTATWPKEVRKIAADLLVNPIQVNIGNIDELVANKSITQYVEVMTSMEKQRRLEQILRSQEPGSKVIIFCSTKKMCDQLSRTLTRQFGAAAIHGDKSQGERDWVLSQFRTGKSPVLVATDVAARGLDVKDIRVVINYDFPTGIEDYVHRIGRTGRAGATGLAYTFFSDKDAKHAPDLIKVLKGVGQQVPQELLNMASQCGGGMSRFRRWGSGPGGGDGGRSYGAGRNDSGYGSRGGRDPPSSGWSERGHGQNDWEPQNRYDGGYNDGRLETHGGRDGTYAGGSNDQGAGDNCTGCSFSPRPKSGSGWVDCRRSRSRSRSVDRYGGGPPSPSRTDASPPAPGPAGPDRLPSPQQWRSSYEGENVEDEPQPEHDEPQPEHGGEQGFIEQEEEGMIPADEDAVILID